VLLFGTWAEDPSFSSYQPVIWHASDYKAHWLWRQDAMCAISPPLEYDFVVETLITHSPIGVLSLSGIDRNNGKAEFSCYFAKRRHTRSIFEAIHLVLHLIFESLGLRKAICHFAPENLTVAQLLSSLVFTKEGLFRAELLDNYGLPRDLVRASLLKSDWNAPDGTRARLERIAPLALDGFHE